MNASAPPKGHDDYEALAVAWAIDSLEPADQAIFEDHRDGCAVCERTVLTMLEVAAELAYGVPDIDPPPQLRRRILAAAAPRPPLEGTSPEGEPRHGKHEPADPGGPAGFAALDLFGETNRTRGTRSRERDDTVGTGPVDTGSSGSTHVAGSGPDAAGGGAGFTAREVPPRESVRGPRSRGRRPSGPGLGSRAKPALGRDERRGSRRRRIVSVLAAVALVGISAVTTWEVTRPAAVTAPVAAPDRTAALSPPAGQGTVATVVVRAGKANVVTDALAPNPDGRRFYMWGVPAGGTGTPQVVGTFQVTTSGLHSYPVQLTRSLADYSVLAISEEATGSTPASPRLVIARGALGR